VVNPYRASEAVRPLVSVVLPTRNRHERLCRALQSVLAQSYSNLEVLVVDDGSTVPVADAMEGVARGDGRVRLFRLTNNSGAACARNVALSHARGGVIAFIDDDDLWKPEKLERQIQFLSDHPQVGIVTSDFEVLDERHPDTILTYRGPRELSSEHLMWFCLPGSFSCNIVRRDAVGGELWLDETFPSVEDWDMWVRCAQHTSIGVVAEALGQRIFHAGGHLSEPSSNLKGLKAFERRHEDSMSKACLAFLRAHQRMQMGTGWRKRGNVLRSLVTASPKASALLVLEQSTRQLGNFRGDPGLVERALARAIAAR
jgi:glycosyltransferase involved in cell wall biosynthesis